MDFEDEFTASEGTSETSERDDFLDLSVWKRCVIDNCQRDHQTNDLIISGYEDKNDSLPKTDIENKRMKCRLQQFWCHCRIEVGDVVSIIAEWNDKFQSHYINNTNGLVVVRPDFLVSGTTVVGGLFCMRKAVLQDRFKGIEAGIKIMTIGSIVHELFQIVLRRRLTTREQIQAAAEEMLIDGEMAYTLYSSNMNSLEARTEFDNFVEKIYEFMQRYVECKTTNTPNTNKPDTFTGMIESIQDIEENIWVPKLGLKGKIDVTVQVYLL